MTEDAGGAMKARLRADLRIAMKERRTVEAKVIRSLVAALDNAEAPAGQAGERELGHRFHSRSAEVERVLLGRSEVERVLSAEVQEREHAAADLDRLNETDRAGALRAEALVARRYLE